MANLLRKLTKFGKSASEIGTTGRPSSLPLPLKNRFPGKLAFRESASTEILDVDGPLLPGGVSQVDEKSVKNSIPKHCQEDAKTMPKHVPHTPKLIPNM